MRFMALATDYDNTLATGGEVPEPVREALIRLRASGRKVFLVTGRELEDVRSVFPHLHLFDRVVAENGGVLYNPATGDRRLLAPPPPPEFVQAMRDRGVRHLVVSSTLVATSKPNEIPALEAIRDLGLDLHVVFNGSAVMILAAGISKASGLSAALVDTGLSAHNVVAVGDAENDYAFLGLCECTAAVANAVPALVSRADLVTTAERGAGVAELIDRLLADDLRSLDARLSRHHILLGQQRINAESLLFGLPPYGTVALLAGPSGAGKSTVTTALLERLAAAGYQFCVFDPEGDYDSFEGAVIVGGPNAPPAADEALQLLRRPGLSVVLNLLRVPMPDRPRFCAQLLLQLLQLRVETGRPHWLVFEEAHHLFPAHWDFAEVTLPQVLETALATTVHPQQIAPALLRQVNTLMTVGSQLRDTLTEFVTASGQPQTLPAIPDSLPTGELLVWRPGERSAAVVTVQPGNTQHRRHVRKYAEGLLIPERSFYFRGPEKKLNLRAHNLVLFVELAEGVDDDTWLHHLRRGDYSRWFESIIGDKALATEARDIEQQPLSAAESRARMRDAIGRLYTLPENPCLPKVVP